MELRIPVERGETDAFQVRADDGLMVDVSVRLVEVSRTVSATIVEQATLQNERELLAGMPVGGQLQPWPSRRSIFAHQDFPER